MFGQEIVNLFANYFGSNYSSLITSNTPHNYSMLVANFIPRTMINFDIVCDYLHRLKSSYSSGPDRVPSSVLKFCAASLAEPLSILFQTSLMTSTFPMEWKHSYIIPLHKKGPRENVSNYRGIAKLNFMPKLFEHIVSDQLKHSLKSVLSTHQHGFVRGRSINTNLLELTSHIIDGFSAGCQTDVVFTDFSKAFDVVNHKLLFKKLDIMGFLQSLILCYKVGPNKFRAMERCPI